jgi:hypothetical protein
MSMACSAGFRTRRPEHTVHSWWYGVAGFGTMALVAHAPKIARALLLLLCAAGTRVRSLASPNLIIGLALLRFVVGELVWERDHGLCRMLLAGAPAGRSASGPTPKGRSRARCPVASSKGLDTQRQLGSAASILAPLSQSGSLVTCSSCGLPFRWFPGRACTVCGSQQAPAACPSEVVLSV